MKVVCDFDGTNYHLKRGNIYEAFLLPIMYKKSGGTVSYWIVTCDDGEDRKFHFDYFKTLDESRLELLKKLDI
jgi:hypothetical protein